MTMRRKGDITFTVNAPLEETWNFLSDIEKVGSCVPGVTEIEVIDRETKLSRWVYKVKVGFVHKTFIIMTRMTHKEPPGKAAFEGRTEDGFIEMEGSISNLAEGQNATTVRYEVSARAGDAIPASLRALLENLLQGRAQRDADQFARNVKERIEGAAVTRREQSVSIEI